MTVGSVRIRSIAIGLTCLALGLLISAILLSPQHSAQFWAIDDHKIIEAYTGIVPNTQTPKPLSGPNNTVTIADLPAELMSSEVGTPGISLRYRPVFQAFHLMEVALWGPAPAGYYVTRTVMFGVLLASILWVSWISIGPLGAAALIFYALGFQMWGDVWCRLGTSEQQAAVGLALFLVGFAMQIRSLFRQDATSWTGSAVLLGLGLIIAAGSKENFVFMAVPVFLLGAYGVFYRRIAIWAAGLVVVSLAFATFIGLAIAEAASRIGTDVYGNAVSVTSRARAPIVFLHQFARGGKFHPEPPYNSAVTLGASLAVLLSLIGLGCVLWLWREPSARAQIRRGLGLIGIVNLLAAVWALWEIVFYGGNWPSGDHYDFPGLLVVLVFAGSIAAALSLLFGPGWLRPSLAVASAALLVAWHADTINLDFPLADAAKHNVRRTQQFSGDLQHIADEAAAHPDWPILIEAKIGWDYEPVATLPDWLYWKKVKN